jgi:hypothetical protein
LLLCALALVLAPLEELRRDDGDRRPGPAPSSAWTAAPSSPNEEAARRAIDGALEFLARAQERNGDGSFSVPRKDLDETSYAPLGVSALCTLAFLADGNAPGRGPHGEVVARAVDYLLRQADLAPGSKEYGYISAQGDSASKTHGHGYATLALAEAYGMSPGSERIRATLIAAVERIEKSQGSEGGWYYEPFAVPLHEGSVTICLVQALRAAENSGIHVDPQVIARAVDYVRRLQKPDGTFRYQLGVERSSIALTAAAISTLNAAGHYDESAIQNGIDAIWSGLMLQDERNEMAEFPEYQRLYLAQAFWQLSDATHFERWYADERARLLRTQATDGSWKGSRFGDCYATAVNCLVLSVPAGLLPIFQR